MWRRTDATLCSAQLNHNVEHSFVASVSVSVLPRRVVEKENLGMEAVLRIGHGCVGLVSGGTGDSMTHCARCTDIRCNIYTTPIIVDSTSVIACVHKKRDESLSYESAKIFGNRAINKNRAINIGPTFWTRH